MLVSSLALLLVGALCASATSDDISDSQTYTYDRYTGELASEELLKKYEAEGLTSTCAIKVAKCDPNERRRLDGSCANLQYPMKGTYAVPIRRVLEAHYGEGSEPRKAASGKDLPLPRKVRTAMLAEGKGFSTEFTAALPGFGVWMFSDVADIHDIRYFLINKTDCCAGGQNDYQCKPNFIPEDDPVHRFSDIRCMNLTRPLAWADFGCTDDAEAVRAPIQYGTSVFDANHVYNPIDDGAATMRTFKGGQLAMDVDENGIAWPPNGESFCGSNQPGETRCFGHSSNELLETMLYSIWTLRHHNYIASELAALNPCWDDETLYQVAKDINSAFIHQIFFYEWLPLLIGFEKLVKEGIISDDPGHRDIHNSTISPEVSLEYFYCLRWFHTIQDGTASKYTPEGEHLEDMPIVDIAFRPGYLAVNNNIVTLTPNIFRRPCAKTDAIVDPELAERGLPFLQRSLDIVTSDVHKSRLLGLAPYIDYVEFFTGHKITSFEDLKQHMEPEKVSRLQSVYEAVADIDVMAGLYGENVIDGGKIPDTMAYMMMEFLYRAVRYDRNWYESSQRPYAFTDERLAEIRKAKIGMLICKAGDKVTEVQREAFRVISPENPLIPCSEHAQLDFAPWADPTCSSSSSDSDSTTQS